MLMRAAVRLVQRLRNVDRELNSVSSDGCAWSLGDMVTRARSGQCDSGSSEVAVRTIFLSTSFLQVGQ